MNYQKPAETPRARTTQSKTQRQKTTSTPKTTPRPTATQTAAKTQFHAYGLLFDEQGVCECEQEVAQSLVDIGYLEAVEEDEEEKPVAKKDAK